MMSKWCKMFLLTRDFALEQKNVEILRHLNWTSIDSHLLTAWSVKREMACLKWELRFSLNQDGKLSDHAVVGLAQNKHRLMETFIVGSVYLRLSVNQLSDTEAMSHLFNGRILRVPHFTAVSYHEPVIY